MNRNKLRKIITVALLSMVISIIGMKSFFYLEHHTKYKKITKLSQPKKHTKVKDIKFEKKKNGTIINNSYNNILNMLLGKNLKVHNQDNQNKTKVKNKDKPHFISFDDFVKIAKQHKTDEIYQEQLKQQEIQRQLEAQKQAELAKQNQPHYINIICTAYTGSADENGGYINKSASGIKLNRGGNYCATPPDIQFGKTIVVEGLGNFEVQDRGNQRYIKWIDENTLRIDIFMNSKKEALNFGVRTYKGYIK
jgi:3D (Asp-Asp-Asp) domain-containing protein